MAAASDSDDASDIFWPGYVDAVTNLAINLLFVIAILSIVTITGTLQLSQMEKKKALDTESKDTKTGIKELQAEQHNGAQKAMTLLKQLQGQVQSKDTAEPTALTAKQLETVLQNLQANLNKLPQKLDEQDRKAAQEQQKLNEKIQQLQQQLSQNQQSPDGQESARAKANTSTGPSQSAQEVLAKQRVIAPAKGQNAFQNLSAGGGVVVVFSTDVVELSDSEASELVRKLTAQRPLKGARWELRVNSPKGFSEATRIAYYRVSNLRNVLLNNGVQPADIEMRVMEVDSAKADNTRVLVRPQP